MSIRSKKDLEIILSRLKTFNKPSLELEQYPTPSNIAAEWVWTMAMKREAAGKIILDAGCGTGILGLGLLLLGAKKVFFLDKDFGVMAICIENYNQLKEEYEIGEGDFIIEDIMFFDAEVDIVVQNPPFGTKDEHADKRFLEKAFTLALIIYSMHKYSTKRFFLAITKDNHYRITEEWHYDFPIKATFKFHEKPVVQVDVGLWRMEREGE